MQHDEKQFEKCIYSTVIGCNETIDIQQTISVWISNTFFVQYHLAIGQTPYVEQQLYEMSYK